MRITLAFIVPLLTAVFEQGYSSFVEPSLLPRSRNCDSRCSIIDVIFEGTGHGAIGIACAALCRTSRFRCKSTEKKFGLCRSIGMDSKQPTSTSMLQSPRDDVDKFETNNILSLDAIALSNAIQVERSVTCEQLMKATLDRIDTINPKYNAIILLRDREVLLSEARSYDQKLEDSKHHSKELGWLHGIPIAIKDVSNAEGLPTTMGGSPLFCDSGELKLATSSDPYVENIVREGAIIIGKTNAPEGGLGSNTFNQKWGKTLNPFAVTPVDTTPAGVDDAEHKSISAGGSSGGAAVAVATKMLVLADGTDNMGSLRNPAGWNNIYSLRPTAGLIASSPPPRTREATNEDPLYVKNRVSPTSILPHPASTPGPMARTPLDCARLLQTMVGDSERCDMRSLWSSAQINTKSTTDSDTHSVGFKVRIGWLGNWGGQLPMEDGILATCQKALEDWSTSSSARGNINFTKIVVKAYPSIGHEETPLFDSDKLWEGYNTIRFASTYEKYSQNFDVDHLLSTEEGETLMKKELAWELMQGRSIDSKALRRARVIYDEYGEWLRRIFSHQSCGNEGDKSDGSSFDFLALPSAQVWPFPIEDRYPKNIEGTPMDTYHRWMEVCVPVSFGGLPCVTIPAGFGRNQDVRGVVRQPLPIGIQLIGKKGDDLKLLHLADSYYHHSQQGTK